MEFDKVIEQRHSCRTFLPIEISDEKINQIVEAGRLAPSSKNAQPWKFVCIKTDFKNEKVSRDISRLMANYYLSNRNDPEKMKGAGSVFATSKIIESCPAIILIFSDSNNITRNSMESISDILSIGASVEHMTLKATDLGLGSLWIADTYFIHKELAEYIEEYLKKKGLNDFILEKHRLICAMAIGEMGEQTYKSSRKNLEDILLIINN